MMHACYVCRLLCQLQAAWRLALLSAAAAAAPAAPLQDCVRLPHLVVVPLTTLSNWERELATWAPYLRVVSLHGSAASRQLLLDHAMFTPHEPGSGRGRAAWQVCCSCPWLHRNRCTALLVLMCVLITALCVGCWLANGQGLCDEH
jgi:hypothetical protein